MSLPAMDIGVSIQLTRCLLRIIHHPLHKHFGRQQDENHEPRLHTNLTQRPRYNTWETSKAKP